MKVILYIIILFQIAAACKMKDQVTMPLSLELVNDYPMQVPEPSGLSSFIDDLFLTVSDSDGKIHVIDSNGVSQYLIDISGNDLEGISFDFTDSLIYSVDELTGKLTASQITGEFYNSWTIDAGGTNSGLEGCSIDSQNKKVFMLKEKSPGRLLIFDLLTENLVYHDLGFAEDYSGIFYDKIGQVLWIISDRSKTVNRCELDGTLIESFSIEVDKAEGIVVDIEANKIFIVGDAMEYLFIYKLP